MAETIDASVEELLVPALKSGIKRLSLREQIAVTFADLVAAGLLREGDELPSERELAATLEVSRDSLRGALQLLAERGILEIGHGTKTRIRQSPNTIDESLRFDLRQLPDLTDEAVIEARRLLEPDLAYRAALRIDAPTLERLAKLLEAQHDMIDDPVRFQISDREFHLAIFEAADNPALTSFASQAYAYAYTYRRELMRNHDGIALAITDHERILDALVSRDAEAAADAMRAHLDTVASLLVDVSLNADIDEASEIRP
ncbi:MAG: FadR/GntR family transcriptional regulator [Geminicoccaceae bacterium]